jgi:hypothetical protein
VTFVRPAYAASTSHRVTQAKRRFWRWVSIEKPVDCGSSGDSSRHCLGNGAADERRAAQVAVYTEHLQWLAAIRRIILRMHAWLNYVV